MDITLSQLLALVGTLDDSPGEGVARERFRSFLDANITDIGQVRDYIEECLRNSGQQYNRALQDLTNFVGRRLGFSVEYGRYQGVQGKSGHDGLWNSPTGLSIVVEVKTTDAYTIKTNVVLDYIHTLIAEHAIPDSEHALGLYIVGRLDSGLRQLEDSIVAQKYTNLLRIISVHSLLSLAEMMDQYSLSHDDILSILRPSGPRIDPLVVLITSLVAEEHSPDGEPEEPVPVEQKGKLAQEQEPPRVSAGGEARAYWLTPVRGDEGETAEQVIERLVSQNGIYAYGTRTPGRKLLKPGDQICFYAAPNGVVAHATVRTKPEMRTHAAVHHGNEYPWVFDVAEVSLYTESPVVIDASLRSRLDEFKGRDPSKTWAWFVQATRRVTEHDFRLLTRATS